MKTDELLSLGLILNFAILYTCIFSFILEGLFGLFTNKTADLVDQGQERGFS